jgi:hypothetical protein
VAATDRLSRVNVFDVVALGVVIGCGLGAIAVVRPETLLGSVLLFAGGCAVPVLGYAIVARFALKSDRLPRCRNNRCRAAQYVLERHTEEGDYYRCSCGDLYLLTPGDEFRFVDLDNTSHPYRRRYYAGGPWRLPVDLNKYKN